MYSKSSVTGLLRSYLGHYHVTYSKAEAARFKEGLPALTSFYTCGPSAFLRKVGCYTLMAFGKQNYLHIDTHDLITCYFNQHDELSYNFSSLNTELLIIYNPAHYVTHKLFPELLLYLYDKRARMGKLTVVLTEIKISDLVKAHPNDERFINKDYVSPKEVYATPVMIEVVGVDGVRRQTPSVEYSGYDLSW